jgi:hypothetical protein
MSSAISSSAHLNITFARVLMFLYRFLVGDGAQEWAAKHGVAVVPDDALITPQARQTWMEHMQKVKQYELSVLQRQQHRQQQQAQRQPQNQHNQQLEQQQQQQQGLQVQSHPFLQYQPYHQQQQHQQHHQQQEQFKQYERMQDQQQPELVSKRLRSFLYVVPAM